MLGMNDALLIIIIHLPFLVYVVLFFALYSRALNPVFVLKYILEIEAKQFIVPELDMPETVERKKERILMAYINNRTITKFEGLSGLQKTLILLEKMEYIIIDNEADDFRKVFTITKLGAEYLNNKKHSRTVALLKYLIFPVIVHLLLQIIFFVIL